MEVITDIFETFWFYFEMIFYYLFGFFFFAKIPAALILKILLPAQIIFLVHTSFHPNKRKWIILTVAAALLIVIGITVAAFGYDRDSIAAFAYGAITLIWGFIMLIATVVCLMHAPFKLKKARNATPAPAEETQEN